MNLAQVVYVEPYEQSGKRGARLHSLLKDKDRKPEHIDVRQAAEKICVF